MTPKLDVPCRVSAEAEAYVAELGLQEQFAEMLERTRQTVPGLQAIEVNLQPPYDLGGDPCVLIEPTVPEPHQGDYSVGLQLAHWKSSRFPPEVSQHFTFLENYGPSDAG
jgi:hypothetical protein